MALEVTRRGRGSAAHRAGALALAATALAAAGGVRAAELALGERRVLVQSRSGHEIMVSPPALALAPDGTPLLAWIRFDAEGRHVYLQRAGKSGGAPVRVDPAGLEVDAIHQAPGLATGPQGEVYVSWSSKQPAPPGTLFVSDLQLSRSLDGGRSFEAPLRVNEERAVAHSFEGIAASGDGGVAVAWIDSREGWAHPGTYVARVVERGSRVAQRAAIGSDTCPCCRVAAAAGPGAALALAWRQTFPGNVRDFVFAESRDGGRSFAGPRRVAVDGWSLDACPHRGGGLALDASGRAWLAWYSEGDDATPRLRLAWAEPGAPFGAPRALHEDPRSLPDHVALAVAGDGRGLVAFEAATAVRSAVVLRLVDGAGGEIGPPLLPAQSVVAKSPALAAGRDGFTAAWIEEEFPEVRFVVQELRVSSGSRGGGRPRRGRSPRTSGCPARRRRGAPSA